jgi:hypothetical protein
VLARTSKNSLDWALEHLANIVLKALNAALMQENSARIGKKLDGALNLGSC